MVIDEQDSGFVQWGLSIFECDPYLHSGYQGETVQHEPSDVYHGQYYRGHEDAECNHVENDEIIARTLQEEFSQLAIEEASQYSHEREEHLQGPIHDHGWHTMSTSNYNSGFEHGQDESDDTRLSGSCSSPVDGEEDSYSVELTNDYVLNGEVDERLNQMVPIPHVPRINGEIPSIDEATSDHERLLNRLQLFGFVERKVEGDGNCQFRALSDQLYNTPEHHKIVRRKVVTQLKSNSEMYEGYVPMEFGDYLKKISKSGEWGDHVTLQAAADVYGVKMIVMTSFKDTCYIEIYPSDQKPKGVIYLSFWAEVHYNSIHSEADIPSYEPSEIPESSPRKKKWWNFG